MTPPECDLRGYEFMPLYGQKLFGSRLYTKALRNPRAGLAAIKLWWSAWQQCPAGSLPDDDDDLAMLTDFGTDVKGWKAVREIALHGFVKCSDGRLYHPVLATHAIEAFDRRRKERERKAKNRAKKDEPGSENSAPRSEDVPPAGDEVVPQAVPRDTTRTDATQTPEVPRERRGEERRGQDRTEQSKEEEENRSLRSRPQPRGDFEAFWHVYRRKVGRGDAEKAYAKALKAGATHAAIMTSVTATRWHDDPQFIPHASTWLNGKRWQDDPVAAAPPPTPVVSRPGAYTSMATLIGRARTQSEADFDARFPTIDADDTRRFGRPLLALDFGDDDGMTPFGATRDVH